MSVTERRRAILDAATRLFEHYGHAKTTIADVAREAQVGVGSVYLEFDSKEAIVAELSVSTHGSVLAAMRAASEKPADPADRLVAVLSARTSSFLRMSKKGHHACELVHCSAPPVRSAQAQFREHERALFEVILKQGKREGAFRVDEPARTAGLVQQAFAVLTPPAIFHAEGDPMRTCTDMAKLLLNGLMSAPRAKRR